jgi:hypothetical protein
MPAGYAICKLRQSWGLMDTAGVARFGSFIKVWLGAVRKWFRNLCRKELRMEKRIYKLGHHLVAFLDVLGQRDKFRGLKKPSNAQEEDEVKEVLRQTAGFVAELRNVFQNQFEVFEAGAPNVQRHTKEPLRPSFTGFSDSFVTSVPLREQGHELVPVVTVFSALSAACVVMLTALASKHPLRGGIDVGLATEIGPSEIYGTALERAYLLECRVAKYPRLVIGDELWRYLNAALAHFENQTTPVSQAIMAIVRKTIQMIATDTDGHRILDYLGPVMVENAGPDHGQLMIQPAYNFVLAEQKRMLAKGDAELIGRYVLLRSYFESRLAPWGVEVQRD